MKHNKHRNTSPDRPLNAAEYKKVSASEFEREMTLVYLMLKDEFSPKNVRENMEKMGITEDMLSPSCKVSQEKLSFECKSPKIEIPGESKRFTIEDVQLMPISITPVQGSVEIRTGEIQVTWSGTETSHIDISVPTNINYDNYEIGKLGSVKKCKVFGTVNPKTENIKVVLNATEIHCIAIPSADNIHDETIPIYPIIDNKVQGSVNIKAEDVQVVLGNTETCYVVIPSVSNIYCDVNLLEPIIKCKVQGAVELKTEGIQMVLNTVETAHVTIPSVHHTSHEMLSLNPVTGYKVRGEIDIKAADILVGLEPVVQSKVSIIGTKKMNDMNIPLWGYLHERKVKIPRLVSQERIYIDSLLEKMGPILQMNLAVDEVKPQEVVAKVTDVISEKVKVIMPPDIREQWESIGGPEAILQDYTRID